METTVFFADLLDIKRPWYVTQVVTNHVENKVDVYVDHEKNVQACCPKCNQFFSVYDHGPDERVYRHLDVCQMSTYIHARLPRVNCPQHGVLQIASEFGDEKIGMTYSFERRLLDVAQACDIQAAARLNKVGWDRCWNAVERAVERGRERKPNRIPERICVDEKSVAKRHVYETLVYDQERSTVEFVCEARNQGSLEAYYEQFEKDDLAGVKSVATDTM